ncbi:MAG TPA: lysylphosphatidylglycerol synthase domain-containing protein [Ilumatobacteraceae bacterium]
MRVQPLFVSADAEPGRHRFFAVPPGAPCDRRPTDITMLVAMSIVLAVFATRAGSPPTGFEASVSNLVASLPSLLDPLWNIFHDALTIWAVVVAFLAVVRRQWALVRNIAVVVTTVIIVSAIVGRLANGTWPDVLDGLFGTDGPVDYPAAGLAMWVAVASVASAHLSRPYRYLGRWIMGLGALATFTLGVTTPSGSIGAVALGLAAAGAVHVVFGSPGGLPKPSEVEAALAGIGVEAAVLDVTRRDAVVRVRARDGDGVELDVKVLGRDAWDGQLLVSLWRFFWYRDGGPTFALTRLQQVEHEAFLTLLAERRGASVNPVIAAGADSIGNALLVIERIGAPLAEPATVVDDRTCASIWQSLAALHAAGISHGAIDPTRIFIDGDSVRFADLSSGEIESSASALLIDRAQLLVATATTFGVDAAIAGALTALQPEGLAEVSSFVQPAALSAQLRRAASTAELDIDEVRAATVAAAGGERRDLQRLHRLTWGRVLMGALLFLAMSSLISSLLDVGLDTIADALREASLPIVVLAFFVSMMARPANAYALSALAPIKVPLSRLTVLQLAMSFVNLAMPSTAGRVAVNIRFFQRSGVDPTTAVAIGAIDGFTGFLGQLTLIGTILLLGLGSLSLSLDESFSLDDVGSLLILLAVVVVVAVAIVAAVPALRQRVVDAYTKLREFLGPFLRSPRRLAKTFGANLVAELIGAMTLYTTLAAFDQSVLIPDVILVSIGVSLFAGLMPVPGGIGVTEAALTAGCIAMGVPEATAFAVALTNRVVTFYTPPIFGWFAFRWLQRQRYL